MKRILSSLLAASIVLAACNNNKPKDGNITISDDKGKVTIDTKQVDQMSNAAEEMQKQKEALEKLPPLTLDQLKALIPETLMGAKRTSYEANASMGAGVASGEYQVNDSINVSLHVYDCAGAAGAGIYGMQFMGLLNIQQESDEEYTKTIEINGNKGFEHCDKTSNQCTITYFTGGRYMITLEGEKVGASALKEVASSLKFN